MMQEKKDNAGFALPAPVETNPAAPAAPATDTAAPAATTAVEGQMPGLPAEAVNTGSRDTMIGGAVLLVLFIAFFFAKNAYANGLVGKRVPPAKANAAGWWMFIFMASLATAVVLAVVNSAKFVAPMFLGPLGAVALVALVLMILSGRK
ncbi:hypothetical protein INH39_18105 [Massilia violaceinigra]|uniref:Uncharacterized protein n=2 Tax=Massilia violaceinigra TaxID=2045208 RepID=A0ABY4AF64_9BURK|nr:hypothetical protein INH39_18105 [Massilia violaceinigra]